MRRLLPLPALLLATSAFAQTPLTLDQVMADPDWIGPPVEQVWWGWDGKQVQYLLKREGASIRDTYRQAIDGGAAQKVDGAARAELDAANPVFDAQRARMAFVRSGDVFVRNLSSGALTQVTRTDAAEALPQWSRDGNLVFRVGNDWYQWGAGVGVSQTAVLKAEKNPGAAPKPDELRDRQLRMIRTLSDDKARRDGARTQDEQWRREDGSRAPLPAYLGDDVAIVDSLLSPDARWLLVVTTAKDADAGKAGKMPKYVTESGYEEFEEVRTRVGHNAPVPQRLWLVEAASAKVSELKFDTLPGIKDDPLAALRKAAKQDPLKGNRDAQVLATGDNSGPPSIRWSDDGRSVAVMIRAIDNKDRWIATVDLASLKLQPRHRLTDSAWVNWGFNEFGWTPDSQLWLLSEQSGYSHLYVSEGGTPRALTSGKWEASAPQLSPDGTTFYFLCNRKWPGHYEVCAVNRNGRDLHEVTNLGGGVEDFALSPDGHQLLVRHSRSYAPPQVSVVNMASGEARQLTDTRKDAFKSHEWLQPEYVQVPSKHGAGTIWGKYYGPKPSEGGQMEAGKKYPIVMFVHGAGYLQNTTERYPNYFREQMFHNMLVERGYIVLDLDYRASEGYGRDWRTAIYRNMGHPELEDYLDGLDWLVANKQGDREHAGIYGGSYGGFMTFMALFRSPGTFKAGAALRPVADWSQYNHEYTSNILNTPELDPQAYLASSPIEYADKLQDHLLIAHGMMDDNVFFKDSVMLSQRLIELHKDKWEIAPYPLERHGFTHPDAWHDEYRRIYELFERTLK